MQRFNIDGLSFDFPDEWHVDKYDEWSFYRNQFIRMRDGIKSLDLLAIDSDKTAWLIEVKDYQQYPRTKPSELPREIADKVFDTLAAMLPAKLNASDEKEKQIANKVIASRKVRIVLHLEQPAKHSKLRPRAINPADIELKLRQLLKPIDAHPLVAERSSMRNLPWIVN